jgi:phosphoglycerate dehydrogenase-like enzyme
LELKLVLKSTDTPQRGALLRRFLRTDWRIQSVDESDPGVFAEALHDADAIVSMDWSAAMPPAPKLRLIHLPGAGTDAIDFATVPAGSAVCNVYEHEIGIAEYVLATVLEWLIGVKTMDAELRRGRWHGSWLCGPQHGELLGKTIGILGYGRIGREVAKRASAFGTRVIACNRSAKTADAYCERIDTMAGFHKLLGESDFVVVALPLDASTTGLFDQAAFAVMKPTAVVINVCRGPVIDEEALYRACLERRIGGAVIDTWYNYPAPGSDEAMPSRFPMSDLKNLIMTPHASAWTDALLLRRCRIIAENLDRLVLGGPLLNVVASAQ